MSKMLVQNGQKSKDVKESPMHFHNFRGVYAFPQKSRGGGLIFWEGGLLFGPLLKIGRGFIGGVLYSLRNTRVEHASPC